ncbi:MAG: hypothetical protein M0Z87_01505 [Actinomycetota bacterium]|nr:hypothetical protein [Actinomycetota bacterium]
MLSWAATKGRLSKSAAAAELQGHVQTLESAISAIVGGSPTAPAKIQMAEAHMQGTASVLSSAIAAAAPSKSLPDGIGCPGGCPGGCAAGHPGFDPSRPLRRSAGASSKGRTAPEIANPTWSGMPVPAGTAGRVV